MTTATAPRTPAQELLQTRFAAIVGAKHAISEPTQLRTYECDGLLGYRVRPAIVVLPGSTEEVAACVKLARELAMPVVPRGAGTGLSGGALPVEGCLLLGLSRMKKILEIDLPNRVARVQPGVINLDISRALAGDGYYYAPDPSSQSVCTIGGNVAENSGGAHCLKYGFTVNHVLGLTLVLPDGEIVAARLARRRARPAGLRPGRGGGRQRGHDRHRHRGAGARAAHRPSGRRRCSRPSPPPTRRATRSRASSARASCRPRSR